MAGMYWWIKIYFKSFYLFFLQYPLEELKHFKRQWKITVTHCSTKIFHTILFFSGPIKKCFSRFGFEELARPAQNPDPDLNRVKRLWEEDRSLSFSVRVGPQRCSNGWIWTNPCSQAWCINIWCTAWKTEEWRLLYHQINGFYSGIRCMTWWFLIP